MFIVKSRKMFKFKFRDIINSSFVVFLLVLALSIIIFNLMELRLKATLTIICAFVMLLILIRLLAVAIVSIKEKKRIDTCKTISKMADPVEKISALESHIKKTTGPDQTYNYLQHDFTPTDIAYMKQKAALLFCLAIAYLENGDYDNVLYVCEKAMAIHPIRDDIYADEEITYGDQCVLLITTCMMNQHRFDDAKVMLKYLKGKEYRNPAARYRIEAHLMVLAINSGDAQEARRLLDLVKPETVKADELSPEYGILYELELHEAMIDILENKHKDAQDKLTDILQNCNCCGVQKRAQQLWDEKYKVTAD